MVTFLFKFISIRAYIILKQIKVSLSEEKTSLNKPKFNKIFQKRFQA